MSNDQPMAIGEYLPRLKAVIAPPADRIYYYVPKEIRVEAKALSKRLDRAVKQLEVGTVSST